MTMQKTSLTMTMLTTTLVGDDDDDCNDAHVVGGDEDDDGEAPQRIREQNLTLMAKLRRAAESLPCQCGGRWPGGGGLAGVGVWVYVGLCVCVCVCVVVGAVVRCLVGYA
mgnify:CR=1 FL=1